MTRGTIQSVESSQVRARAAGRGIWDALAFIERKKIITVDKIVLAVVWGIGLSVLGYISHWAALKIADNVKDEFGGENDG